MANYISKQKGKVLSGYNKLLDHKTVNDVPTSEVNKLWRGMILINRVTSKLPKDIPDGKMYTPNQIVGKGFSLRNPQKNPKLNEETKRKWENILANGYTNDLGLPLDDPIVVDVAKGKKPTNALQKHQELQSYNQGRNQVIIYNLTSNGSYSYLVLQNRPPELEFKGETSWASIHSMGRNNPMYHYTGAEDTLQFNISWFCSDPDNPAEVINKCRLLESWSKANGYLAAPPIIKIQWGASGIFDNHKYILASATYTLKNFQNGHIDRRSKNPTFVDTKLFPMVATQELIFKRVSDHNIGYGDIIDSESMDKTKGVGK